jgi:hypothetical protein
VSEAERLAKALEACDRSGMWYPSTEAAAELRRLSAELEALKKAISEAQPVAQWKRDTEDGLPMFDVDEPNSYELSLGWEPLYTLKGIK